MLSFSARLTVVEPRLATGHERLLTYVRHGGSRMDPRQLYAFSQQLSL
jgi:hypothetical protein